MACALMHEPEILFLDEPTSGVDPLARREFWQRINALAEQGVTVMVTTHFMEEAEYCDRLAIMAAGAILAMGDAGRASRPAPRIRARARARAEHGRRLHPTLIAASTATSVAARQHGRHEHRHADALGCRSRAAAAGMRLRGLVRKEFLQIVRDPSSIAIAFLMPIFLLLLFGYGVSLDAEHVPVAAGGGAAARRTRRTSSPRLRQSPLLRAAACPHPGRGGAGAEGRPGAAPSCACAPDFAEQLRRPDGAPIQVIVNGVDANTARLMPRATWRAPGATGWRTAPPARGETLATPVQTRAAGVVQQRAAQPQLPGARPGRHHHDPDRRAAHRDGDGARVGARHHGGAAGDAGRR